MVTSKERLCESCVFAFGTELYNIDRCDDCNKDDKKHHYQVDPSKPRVIEEVVVNPVGKVPRRKKMKTKV